MNPNNFLIKALKFMENILYKYSDCVVVLAEGLQDYVKNKGAKKVVWLPNGPDLEKFSPLSKTNFSNFFTKSNPFKLIYAGAHGVANDLGNVIEAAKLILDYPIKIILNWRWSREKRFNLSSKGFRIMYYLKILSKRINTRNTCKIRFYFNFTRRCQTFSIWNIS